MSSMTRTIKRSKKRLHWPTSAWKEIAESAVIWRRKKAEKKLARKQIRLPGWQITTKT